MQNLVVETNSMLVFSQVSKSWRGSHRYLNLLIVLTPCAVGLECANEANI